MSITKNIDELRALCTIAKTQHNIPRCLETLQFTVSGRPFVKRFALCYRTVVLSVLSVTFVHCGQTVGRIKMKLGMQVGLGPGHIVLGGDRALPPLKGGSAPSNFRPIFSEHELSFTFAMLSPVRLSSVVCLYVVRNARAPYSGGSNFRQYFYGIWYPSHPLTSTENFTEIVPGEPLRRGS